MHPYHHTGYGTTNVRLGIDSLEETGSAAAGYQVMCMEAVVDFTVLPLLSMVTGLIIHMLFDLSSLHDVFEHVSKSHDG